MKNKGFTLIELLAVIVILAVIALIATPMIMDVIEKSKKSSLQDSAYGLVDAADMYYTEHIQEGIQEPIVFEFENGVQISEQKLTYKGKIQEGKLILNTNGKTVVCISDGKYYAYKNIEESEVTGGTGSCKYNGETGDFEIISDVDTLNERIKTLQEELNTLKGQGDATAEEIKEGKTAVVQGELITGSMEDKSGQTVTSNTVTKSGENALITVPENGYYNTSSQISVPIETIQNSVDNIFTFKFSRDYSSAVANPIYDESLFILEDSGQMADGKQTVTLVAKQDFSFNLVIIGGTAIFKLNSETVSSNTEFFSSTITVRNGDKLTFLDNQTYYHFSAFIGTK